MGLHTHTVATVKDEIGNTVVRTESWGFPFGNQETVGGEMQVLRLIREGSGEDHDEVVVIADADSRDANWTYLWSSDPTYPFNVDMVAGVAQVFSTLPDDICDLIETETGLDMAEARP